MKEQRQSMFHYGNSYWTPTHGIFTLNLKLITPELLACELTVSSTAWLSENTKTYTYCIYVRVSDHSYKQSSVLPDTDFFPPFSPTTTNSLIKRTHIHQKAWKTMISHMPVWAYGITQSLFPYCRTQWKENPITSVETVSGAYRMEANCHGKSAGENATLVWAALSRVSALW